MKRGMGKGTQRGRERDLEVSIRSGTATLVRRGPQAKQFQAQKKEDSKDKGMQNTTREDSKQTLTCGQEGCGRQGELGRKEQSRKEAGGEGERMDEE